MDVRNSLRFLKFAEIAGDYNKMITMYDCDCCRLEGETGGCTGRREDQMRCFFVAPPPGAEELPRFVCF
jgi:hypothetical protein